jgi:heme/copper-type cytochrome/quinol oxidase subunit 3
MASPGPLAADAIEPQGSGWWALIFMICTEAALFGYLLFSYFYLAAQPHLPATFPQGGTPSMQLALPNTVILLLSSAAVAWAQYSIERDRPIRLAVGLGIGAVLGVIFLGVQVREWLTQPFALASSAYSSLYFTVTGFHMAHVLAGVLILWTLCAWSVLGYFNRARNVHVHIGALYWHFVDVVWLAVFATFYLLPRLSS